MKLSASGIHHAVMSHQGVYPEQLDGKALNEAECMSTVMVLPKDATARLQLLGNITAQLACNYKPADTKLRVEFQKLSESMSYLLNSTSFQDGIYHSYDAAEIDRKLRR